MNSARVELARQAIDAWNRRDADWVISHSVPDIEFVPAVVGSLEGESRRRVRGTEGFRGWFADLDETWERFEVEAEEFREVGEVLVTVCRVHAKGRGSGLALDEQMAMVSWFRGDKFARAQSFLDLDEALEAAKQRVAA
jgi:ketosteroid isomerase-like protein